MTSIIYGAVCGGHHDSRHRREVKTRLRVHGRLNRKTSAPASLPDGEHFLRREARGGTPRNTRPTSAPASGDRSSHAKAPTSGARPPRATRKWRSGARPPARSTRRRSSGSRAWTRCPWRTSTPTSARRRTSSLRSTIRPRPPAARWPGCAGCSGSFKWRSIKYARYVQIDRLPEREQNGLIPQQARGSSRRCPNSRSTPAPRSLLPDHRAAHVEHARPHRGEDRSRGRLRLRALEPLPVSETGVDGLRPHVALVGTHVGTAVARLTSGNVQKNLECPFGQKGNSSFRAHR